MSSFSNTKIFDQAAQTVPINPPPKKRPAPLSLRLSEEQKAQLRRDAEPQSVNSYVIAKLFGESAVSRRRMRKPPSVNHEALGRVLGALGQSRLSQNMNQIAKASHTGALPVTPELAAELTEACADIRAMREALMQALGVDS